MAGSITKYKGNWQCTHWYPSNKHVGDDYDEHEMRGYWDDDQLVLESLPSAGGSYIFVRLRFENDIATGSWHETTTKAGDFKGAQYSGYGQLTVDPKTFYMEGKWAGAGYDRKLKRIRIYTGNWEIKPLQAVR